MADNPTAVKPSLQTLYDLETVLCSLLARTDRTFTHPNMLNPRDRTPRDRTPAQQNCAECAPHHQNQTSRQRVKKSSPLRSKSSYEDKMSGHNNKMSGHNNKMSSDQEMTDHRPRTARTTVQVDTPKWCGWSVHQQVASLEEQLDIRAGGSVCRVRSGDVRALPQEIKLVKPTCHTEKERVLSKNCCQNSTICVSKSAPAKVQSTEALCSHEQRKTFTEKKCENDFLVISKMVEMKPRLVEDGGKRTKHHRFFQVSRF